jgi:hypothetical protein
LDAADTGDCLGFLEEWRCARVARHGPDPGLEDELRAARNAVLDADRLEVDGLVLRLDGRVAGLGIAARLSSDTAVLHVEKAATGVTGLYQYLDREVARHLLHRRYRWINKESDLGRPELRRAKTSARPSAMVRCFRLHLGGTLQFGKFSID